MTNLKRDIPAYLGPLTGPVTGVFADIPPPPTTPTAGQESTMNERHIPIPPGTIFGPGTGAPGEDPTLEERLAAAQARFLERRFAAVRTECQQLLCDKYAFLVAMHRAQAERLLRAVETTGRGDMAFSFVLTDVLPARFSELSDGEKLGLLEEVLKTVREWSLPLVDCTFRITNAGFMIAPLKQVDTLPIDGEGVFFFTRHVRL